MKYRGINIGCTTATKADDSIKELISAECFDFLSKILHPIADKRMSLYEAWMHPWMTKFKKRTLTISRPRAFESLKAIISYSLNSSKLLQMTSFYINRNYMSELESTYFLNSYLFYDRAHLGIVQVSDIKRILLEGDLHMNDDDLLFFCKRLGLPSLEEDVNDHTKINGFYTNDMLLFLSRDMDVFTYHKIKWTFDFFDFDKNGLLTPADFKNVINPEFFNMRKIEEMFLEVQELLKEPVVWTGINLR